MAFNSLPLELIDHILSYVVPWHWNAEWRPKIERPNHFDNSSAYRDAQISRRSGYELLVLRLVSRQFCATISRELLRKAHVEMLVHETELMNIDSLTALYLTKYDMGPKHQALALRRAAASASVLCRWKEARNECPNEALYFRAACSTMVASNGHEWAYYELRLDKDDHGHSAPVQLAMNVGGDAELQLLEHGCLSIAAFLGDLATMEALLKYGANAAESHGLYGCPVYAAASAGQVDAMRLLIDAGAEVVSEQGAFGSPLEVAARHGHLAAVQFLLEQNVDIRLGLCDALIGGHEEVAAFLSRQMHGDDVNAAATVGKTPIWLALRYGYRDIALQLCTYPNLDANEPGPDKIVPLYQAVSRHWTDVVRALLLLPTIRVDVCVPGDGTPLHLACKHGYDDIVRLLLDRDGIDYVQYVVNIRPIDYAMRAGHHSTARLLLEHPGMRADIVTRRSPLETAIERGDTELVELLLERPEVRSSKADCKIAMFCAIKRDSLPIVQRLVDVFSPDLSMLNDYEQSLAEAAVMAGHLDIADFLLALPGTGPESLANDAELLCVAAMRGRLDTVQYLLLGDGVQANTASDFGSPLRCAIVWQRIEVVRYLLQQDGVDVNASTPDPQSFFPDPFSDVKEDVDDPYFIFTYAGMCSEDETDWSTPLLSAIANISSLEIFKLLLDHSAIDPNKADESGLTPLYAVINLPLGDTREEMARLLLAHPATDPNIGHKEVSTPLLYAVSRSDTTMVELLLQHPKIDPNCVDNDGFTPLFLANIKHEAELAELLYEHPRIDIKLAASNWSLVWNFGKNAGR